MERQLVAVWVMVAVLSTIIMDSITGTFVNLQNGFNPWSNIFRGFKLS
jgi:hypothetical protein